MSPVAVFVGAPGSGKTTIGRRVAAALGVPFVDSDHLIEARAGMTVSDIFLNEGEAAFRAMEEEVVVQALGEVDGVLSLGGGAVLSEATRSRLAGHRVVWLRVTLADAARRVGMNTARPLLLGNVRAQLGALLEARTPCTRRSRRSWSTPIAVPHDSSSTRSWNTCAPRRARYDDRGHHRGLGRA